MIKKLKIIIVRITKTKCSIIVINSGCSFMVASAQAEVNNPRKK
ncbi:hypothetical protein [Clostridium sp. CF012]|nr:hypothetical protein [Clostridium sp. CF012]